VTRAEHLQVAAVGVRSRCVCSAVCAAAARIDVLGARVKAHQEPEARRGSGLSHPHAMAPGARAAALALLACVAVVGVHAYDGEDDPDAHLVRFVVGPFSTRLLPTVDENENDAYCVASAVGREVFRLPVQPEVGRSAVWDEHHTFDVPLPLLDNAPGPHVLTLDFYDDDSDEPDPADDRLGSVSVDIAALAFGTTTLTELALINPEPGRLTVTISKELVDKTLTVTSPAAGAFPNGVAAGAAVPVAWDTDGLISTVTVKLFSDDTGLGEVALESDEANTGSLTVVLPNWVESGADFELRVYDGKNASVVGASAPFAVRGATLDLVGADEDTEIVLGVEKEVGWDVFGAVTDIDVVLYKGGTVGAADGTLIATLATGEAGSGSAAYTAPLEIVPGDDYRVEVTGTVEDVRAMAASSGFFSVVAIAVATPTLVQARPHVTGNSVSIGEEVAIAFTAGDHVENVKIVLMRLAEEALVIAASTPNDGSFEWTVDAGIAPLGEEYHLHVEDVADATFAGDSEGFDVNGPTVDVLFPAPGATSPLLLGTTYEILWVARGAIEAVTVELLDGGNVVQTIAAGVNALQGSVTWSPGVELPGLGGGGIGLEEGSGAGGDGGGAAIVRPPSGSRSGYSIRIDDTGVTGAGDVTNGFTLAYAADAPDFGASGPPTVGKAIALPVVARPSTPGAFVFASLVEVSTNANLALWPEVFSIGIVPLPTPEAPGGAVQGSITWQVPVSRKLVELGARGDKALALRLRLLDGSKVYEGVTLPFGVLVPLQVVPSAWTDCTKTCGGGTHRRSLKCRKVSGFGAAPGDEVPLSQCEAMLLPLPATSGACNTFSCDGVGWGSSAWSACSQPCGPGERTRDVYCTETTNGDTSRVADSVCRDAGLAASRPAEAQSCFIRPCELFSWVPRGWTECTKQCGGGMRYRSVECVGSYGTIVTDRSAANPCAGTTPPPASEPCGIAACEPFAWHTAAWSKCTERCGGGTMSRAVTCVDTATGDAVDEGTCDADTKFVSNRVCNTSPCRANARYWDASAFGECSAACGGGEKRRTVTCVDADGNQVDEAECAVAAAGAGTKPSPVAACNTHACAPCAGEPCSGHGTCAADEESMQCHCSVGYTGAFCATPDTCAGAVDVGNECCAGVLMSGGVCCGTSSDAAVDSRGECCESGVLDACGVCDGTSTLRSVTGECCAADDAPELDGAGLCCPAGFVDACGVCGGDGLSCSVVMSVTIEAPAGTDVAAVTTAGSAAALEFAADRFPALIAPILDVAASRIDVMSVATVDGQPTKLRVTFSIAPAAGGDGADAGVLISRVNEAAAGGAGAVVSVDSTSTAGVCGNDVCEFGEACSTAGGDAACCPNDCPITLKVCAVPAGSNAPCGGERRGQCVASTGTCSCWQGAGYTGEDCGQCAAGFARSGGDCVPVFEPRDSFLESDVPEWAVAVIAILGAALLVAVTYCFCRSQGKCGGGKPSGGHGQVALPQWRSSSVRYT